MGWAGIGIWMEGGYRRKARSHRTRRSSRQALAEAGGVQNAVLDLLPQPGTELWFQNLASVMAGHPPPTSP